MPRKPASTPNNKPSYPWSIWFNKPKLVLRKGKDYQCQTHGMIGQIRNYASRSGLSVRIRSKDDVITVTKD